MAYEDPHSLLSRLRPGREEYAQRLLTSLIVGGAYPRWNTRNTPSVAGVAFLQALDELCFGQAGEPAQVFVDELDLPPRHPDEKGGAPDQAVLWEDRLWLIELKTEPGSHRRTQLPSYFDLGAQHFPAARLDITYLTPRMSVDAPSVMPPNRYAHVTWDAVADLVQAIWGATERADERNVTEMLLRVIATLGSPPNAWRDAVAQAPMGVGTPPGPSSVPPPAAPAPTPDVVDEAIAFARQTSADGRQRAVDLEPKSLEALQELRLQLRKRLCADADDSPLRRVMPWLWNADKSGGKALTAAGAETGYELRLSRCNRPVC